MALGTQNRVEILLTAKDEASKRMEAVAKSVQDMASKIRNLAREMTMAGAAIVGAIAGTAYKLGALAGELQKMAAQTGTTTEQFQRLKYAVEQNDGSAENLVMAMTILRRQSVEASRGGQQAQEMFTRMGVSFKNTDGTVRNTIDILKDLADVVKSGAEDPEVLADSLESIGLRGGRNLIPFLQQGKKGIEDFMKATPYIISDESLDKLDRFEDRVNAIKTQIIGTISEALVPLLPHLTKFVDFIGRMADKFDALSPKTKEMAGKLLLFSGVVLLLTGGPLLMLSGLLSTVANVLNMMIGLKMVSLVTGISGLGGAFGVMAKGILGAVAPLITALVLLESAFRIGGLIANQVGHLLEGIGGLLNKKELVDFGTRLAAEGLKEVKEGVIIPMIKEALGIIPGVLEAALKIPEIKIPELPGAKTPALPEVTGAGAGAGIGKGQFGIEQFIPAMMGVQGAFAGTFRPNMNVIHLTIYAEDRKVGDLIQREIDKRL